MARGNFKRSQQKVSLSPRRKGRVRKARLGKTTFSVSHPCHWQLCDLRCHLSSTLLFCCLLFAVHCLLFYVSSFLFASFMLSRSSNSDPTCTLTFTMDGTVHLVFLYFCCIQLPCTELVHYVTRNDISNVIIKSIASDICYVIHFEKSREKRTIKSLSDSALLLSHCVSICLYCAWHWSSDHYRTPSWTCGWQVGFLMDKSQWSNLVLWGNQSLHWKF